MEKRLLSAASFFAPFFLYVATLAPTVTFEDSGEFIAAASHLGVPHPPGYPLWCLLAHAFTWIPWGSVAERVHLCSAFFGAATAWFVYSVTLRLFGNRIPALVASLALAVSGVHWSQSVVAEVYTLNSFFTMLLVYLALRWREQPQPRWLYALALTLGLGLANHLLLALVALPIFGWLLFVDWRKVLRPAIAIGGTGLLLLGLSVYLYLPIRASEQPPVNVGNPDTLAKTLMHVRRDAYRQGDQGRYVGSPEDVARHTGAAWTGTAQALGWPLALLAVAGVVVWPKARRDVLAMTVGIAVFNTLVVNAIQMAHFDAWGVFVHRVFYLPAHAMASLWLASGTSTLLWACAKLGRRGRPAAAAVLVAALALTFYQNYPAAHRQGDFRARNYGLDLLDSAPKGSGFLPIQDEVVYPLVYLKWVEGLRRDIHILSAQYGWRKEPPSSWLFGAPIGEALREDFPELRDAISIPHGIAYLVVPRNAAKAQSYASFVALPGPHRDLQLDWPGGDPFNHTIRSRYAAYHARLGAKYLAGSRHQAARAEFERVAEIDPGDAYVAVLLFEIYRHFDVHPARWRPLLETALEHFDAKVDPKINRYYPIRRSDIERYLESLEPREK